MASVGLRGAMPSHNSVLDVPVHGNRWLIRNVLREEFGGGNMSLVSDCDDIGAAGSGVGAARERARARVCV